VDSAQDGELELTVSELDRSWSPDFSLLGENSGSNDGDGIGGSSVISGHFSVQLTDGSVQRDISVLLVHVVVSGSRLVSEDDAEGLDMGGSPLEDLIDSKDLALGRFSFELSAQMVPEFGFGDDLVAGEETDGIDLGVAFLLGGQFASQNEILSDLYRTSKYLHLQGGIGGILRPS
jgi:hypothetical protein